MNFLQKMMLRVNPRYIEKIKSTDLTVELIEYAFEQGYDVRRVNRLINNRAFLEYYKSHKNADITNEIVSNFDYIPLELSEEFKHEIIYNSEYILNSEYGELSKDFDLILKTIRNKPANLKTLYIENIPDERIEEFIEVLDEKGITSNDWDAYYWSKNKKLINYFLSKDYDTTFEALKSTFISEAKLEEIFIDNLPNGVEHIDEIYNKYSFEIEEAKKEKIFNALKSSNYTINDKTPLFLYKNKEIVYKSLLKDPSLEVYIPSDFVKSGSYDGVYSEEESIAIANEVINHNYIPTDFLKKDPRVVSEIIKLNPYIVEDSYILNRDTAPTDYIYNENNANLFVHQDNFLDELERNFDIVSNCNFYIELKNDVEVYKICKQNEYVLTSASPLYLKKNPYLVMEALEKGSIKIEDVPINLISGIYNIKDRMETYLNKQDEKTISEIRKRFPGDYYRTVLYGYPKGFTDVSGKYLLNNASYDQRMDVNFIMDSIRENFASIIYARASIEDFSLEQQKEIAKLYFENDEYEFLPRYNSLINDIISENDKRGWNIVSEEKLKKMAKNYWEEKGMLLTSDAKLEEQKNPYIIAKSIEEDPQTIDFAIIEITPELQEKYHEYKRTGKYKISTKTPKNLFSKEEVNKAIEERDRAFAEDYWAKRGNVLTSDSESEARQNMFIIVKSLEEDPQTLDYIELEDIPEYFYEIGLDKKFADLVERYYGFITEGKYIVTSNTPSEVLEDKRIKSYLLQDINNIIFYPRDVLKDVKLISRIDEAIKLDKFVFGDIIPPIYYRNRKTDYEIIEYILSKDIHNIEKMNLRWISDEYIENLINSGRYPLDESADARILTKTSKIFMSAFRKNNNIIFMDSLKNESITSLTIDEQQEIASLIDSNYVINEETPKILKGNVFVVMNSLINNIESAKFCDPIENDKIKEFVSNLNIDYSDDLSPILKRNHPLYDIEEQRYGNNMSSIKKFYKEHKAFCLMHPKYLLDYVERKGFILDADSPEFMRSDKKLVLRTLEQDWSFIEHVSPLMEFDIETQKSITDLAIKNNYIIDDKSLFFLRRSPTLVLNSIKSNENFDMSLVNYIDFSLCSKKQKNELESILVDALLNDKCKLSEYAIISTITSKESILKLIEKDISNINFFGNKLFLLSTEEQRKIYEIYLKQKDEIEDIDKINNLMMQNSFFVMKYVKENISEIDKISFDGLVLTDEFKNEIAKELLDNGYVVNDKTPMFIRKNHEFIYQYLIKNNLEFNGLEAKDIAPLLMVDELQKNPKYIDLYKFLEEGKVHSDSYIYIKAIGVEKACEYFSKYGNLIKYIDMSKQYKSEEEIRNALKDRILTLPNNKGKYLLMYNLGIDFKLDDQINESVLHDIIISKPEIFECYYGSNERILKIGIDNGYFENKTNEEIIEYLQRNSNCNTSSNLMKYLIEEKSVEYLKMYKGISEEVFKIAIDKGFFDGKTKNEIEEYFLKSENGSKSMALMSYVIDNKSVDYFKLYNGSSEELFEKAILNGFLAEKTEEEIKKIISEKANASYSTAFMKHVIENYNVKFFDYYEGNNESLFEFALEKDYEVSPELFIKKDNFMHNKIMVKKALSKDPYLLAYITENNTEYLFRSLELIAGEKIYNDLISNEDIKEEIIGLYGIGESVSSKTRILKMFKPQILSTIGYKNNNLEIGYDINTLIKYANTNPMLDDVVKIVNDGKYEEFIEFYKYTKNLIDDESAIGINKFLHFAQLYNVNPDLCVDMLEKSKAGYQLNDIEKNNFYTILYKNIIDNKKEVTLKNLSTLLDNEKEKYIENLENYNDIAYVKNDLFKYFFAYDDKEIKDFLMKNMNTLTLNSIITRAKECNNIGLQLIAEEANIIFEVIEQIQYYDGDINKLKEIANKIYNAPSEEIYKIRASCGNLKELIRQVYEVEAQTELTNLDEILNDGDYTTLPEAPDVKVIDLSDKKHTIYGHVLGTSMDAFFDMQKGKVTICLSSETDVHEAYYWNDKVKIKLGFTKMNSGNYIGSSTQNMGSNYSIKGNDYRTDDVEKLFKQKSIRNLYEKGTLGKGHSEILAYRKDLIPTCIIMSEEVPSEIEISACRELRKKIKEITGEDVEIPLVKTQHAHNRVLDYKDNMIGGAVSTTEETERIQKEIKRLREAFLNVLPLNSEIVRKDSGMGEYIIENSQAYAINDITDKSSKRLSIIEAQRAIQGIVHGGGNEICLETTKKVLNAKEVIATKLVDAEPVYSYMRGGQNFSKSSSSVLLKEFMVDHLMFCYSTNNDDILLNSFGKIYRKGGEDSLNSLNDFINSKGEIYTNMSYFYFDSDRGNNIYRKVFENYINNPDTSQIFSQSDFDEFVESAKKVQEIDDEEYLKIFNKILESSENPDQFKQMLLKRKQTIVKESENFVERLKETRKIEQNPEKFENTESIAIINDVHGNLAALESILEECKKTGKNDIFILGDMIGFGPQSDECLDLIRAKSSDLNIRCILGNHELYSLMGNKNFETGVDDYTTQTRRSLSDENRRFIESLPISRKIEIDGKVIELAHYLYNKNEKEDAKIYTGHDEANITNLDSNIDYIVYGHEHGTENNIGDEVGEIRTQEIENISCVNLPSSGCVHGRKTTYVTIDKENGLQFNVNAISYDKEKNDEAVRQNSPQKAHFFGVER